MNKNLAQETQYNIQVSIQWSRWGLYKFHHDNLMLEHLTVDLALKMKDLPVQTAFWKITAQLYLDFLH